MPNTVISYFKDKDTYVAYANKNDYNVQPTCLISMYELLLGQ